MADTIKSTHELDVGLDYYDALSGKEKTAYIKIPNPKANLTESTIRTQMTTFINAGIIRDPNDEPLSSTSIGTAFTVDETKIDIDLDGD